MRVNVASIISQFTNLHKVGIKLRKINKINIYPNIINNVGLRNVLRTPAVILLRLNTPRGTKTALWQALHLFYRGVSAPCMLAPVCYQQSTVHVTTLRGRKLNSVITSHATSFLSNMLPHHHSPLSTPTQLVENLAFSQV